MMKGSQGRKLKTGIVAETMRNASLPMACSSSFLTETRGGTTYNELPPQSIINQGNASRDLPAGQSNEGNSSVEIPSSQLCLGLCRVERN